MDLRSEILLYGITIAASTAFYLVMALLIVDTISRKLLRRFTEHVTEREIWAWRASCCSTINAIFMTTSSILIMCCEDLRADLFWFDSFSTRIVSSVEVGYFVADMVILCVFDDNPKLQYLIHHSVCIIGLGMITVYKTLAFYTCLRGISELSTPFMNIRWALATWKMKGTKAYLLNGVLFLTTFFLGRIVTIPIFYYNLIPTLGSDGYKRLNVFCKVVFFGTSICLDCLNINWFRIILKGFTKGIRERYSVPHKGE